MKRVLIVDDDPSMVYGLIKAFTLSDFAAQGTAKSEETIPLIESFQPEIVILDVFFGRPNQKEGLELLERIRQQWANLPVLMITGQSESTELYAAMNLGADDFIGKPFETDELLEKVKRILASRSQCAAAGSQPWSERIVGKSKVMLDLTMKIWRAAKTRSDVLILGETGTGKDLVAREYYRQSLWCKKPIEIIYCPNIPKETFEAELFGYKAGAFTSANQSKIGLVQKAEGGIVFLNEIGDIPLEVQTKLLRLLDNKEIQPLGATEKVKLDVVILIATNRDLKSMAERGDFRLDLYNRFCKSTIIEIPPLREHLEDLPLLVDYFKNEISQRSGSVIQSIDPKVLELFKTLRWEGNIRQLRNCLEEGARRCYGGQVLYQDLAEVLDRFHLIPAQASGLKMDAGMLEKKFKDFKDQVLRKLERDYLLYHLHKHHWNMEQTAQALGIPQRQQINQMMKRMNIERPKEIKPKLKSRKKPVIKPAIKEARSTKRKTRFNKKRN